MIRQLRKNFILVALGSTLAVLSIIIGALNIVSYRNVAKKADIILELLSQNDARFPKNSLQKEKEKHTEISPETPYETRFFSVRFTKDGEVITVDTGKIAAIATKEAIQCANEIRLHKKTRGFFGNYRYLLVNDNEWDMVVMIDASRELTSFRIQLKASVGISLLGLLAVFVLIVVFSKKVFRPVAESYEKQKRFITDASHELKTPLTIISANVEVLEMEADENQWTASIKKQVDRLSHLVQQMVTLSRMDEEQQETTREVFSLSEAVADTVNLFLPVAKQQEKNLSVTVEENILYQGDEGLIRQMLSLLLDNALKYSSLRGQIQVTLKDRGKRKEIRVYNTVDHISKGNLNILFERFYRPDCARNMAAGGSGIGLSIVKAIVDTHKGKIIAKSEDGKTIEFVITL